MGAARSPAARRGSPAGATPEEALAKLAMEALPGRSDSEKDVQVKGLRGKTSEMDAAAKALLGRADAPMSTEEQVAQLLVGILPGLLGMAVGGAVGGTTGAFAGAGGGFQGSADGLNRANKDRREDRARLVERGERLQQRMDDLEKQIGLRKDRLEDRDLTQVEQAKQRNQVKELQNQQDAVGRQMQRQNQSWQSSERSKDRAQERVLKAEELGFRERESAREFYRAQAAAAAKGGGELKEHQQKLAILLPTIRDAVRIADKMDSADGGPPQAKAINNAANAVVPRSWESDAYREYEDAAMTFAQHYTFAVSGAQAPETEVKRMRDFFFAKPGDSEERRREKQSLRDQASSSIATLISNPNQARELAAQNNLPVGQWYGNEAKGGDSVQALWGRGKAR
jgi:hypothetical protein